MSKNGFNFREFDIHFPSKKAIWSRGRQEAGDPGWEENIYIETWFWNKMLAGGGYGGGVEDNYGNARGIKAAKWNSPDKKKGIGKSYDGFKNCVFSSCSPGNKHCIYVADILFGDWSEAREIGYEFESPFWL